MNKQLQAPTAAEFLAQILPPAGYENHIVVKRHGVLVWTLREDLQADDAICFYDGDCREVFNPDASQLNTVTK